MNVDSTEPREPSYYEVALTNRQVLVAFVVLLTCLLAAFLSGVWVGRGRAPARAAAGPPAAAPAPAEPIEQLTFFSAKQPVTTGGAKAATTTGDATPAKAAPKPAAGPKALPQDAATETMRRTLQAEMDAHREPAAASASPSPAAEPPVAATPVPGTRTRRAAAAAPPSAPAPSEAKAPAETKPAASEATADGTVWIQVYSSTNGVHAREIAARLRKAGFKVVLADFEKDGQTQTRVRVGPFPSRDKADPVAARLRREQRLDTWVTDSP
jgi:cell division protein FtsN